MPSSKNRSSNKTFLTKFCSRAAAFSSFHGNNFRKGLLYASIIVILSASTQPLIKLVQRAYANSIQLASQPAEKIKLMTFGNCSGTGYGYLAKIVPSLPDPSMFPITRYDNYNRFPHVLFSDARTQYDERILVGIDLDESDIQEVVITQASWESTGADPAETAWVFKTVSDYDLLTGFVFYFEQDGFIPPTSITVTLYDMPQNFVQIGQWNIKITNQGALYYPLDKPIKNFSFNRGDTNFVMIISNVEEENPTVVKIRDIEVLGVKVDISDYTIFHRSSRNGRCFAAIKNSFREEISSGNHPDWEKYLEEKTNVKHHH